jgi:hypothetical protein
MTAWKNIDRINTMVVRVITLFPDFTDEDNLSGSASVVIWFAFCSPDKFLRLASNLLHPQH